MSMEVKRVETFEHGMHGSKIEPPMKQYWGNLKKLAWHAAVVKADTGVDVRVVRGNTLINGIPLGGQYHVQYANGVAMTGDFHNTWSYLNGIALGVRLTRKEFE